VVKVTITILPSFCAAAISNPFRENGMSRNPNERNSGNLISLYEFLNLAKNSTSLSGILISLEVSYHVPLNLEILSITQL